MLLSHLHNSAGGNGDDPDFAWNPKILVIEDRLFHKVTTPTTTARYKEITRLQQLAIDTKNQYKHLATDDAYIFYREHIQREL